MIRVVATGWAPQYPRRFYEVGRLRFWRVESARPVWGPTAFSYHRRRAFALHFGRTYFCVGSVPR